MKADLHMHSLNSDGIYPVDVVVKRAYDKGIKIIALTDHDTFKGVSGAEAEAKKYGIRLIKGAEISTYYQKEPVHVLVYFNEKIPDEVLALQDLMRQKRRTRALDYAKNLERFYGLKFDYQELEAFAGNLTRGNIYRHALKKNPELEESEETFNKYFLPEDKAYIPSINQTTEEVVTFYRQFPCLIVLAHPTLYTDETLEAILKYDFDGIEALYARYQNHDINFFKEIALKKGWLITAGSDFHGDKKHGDIGDVYLEGNDLDLFLERIEKL